MHALTAGSRRARPTSLHVFLALVTMVVTLALAIGLAGQPRADRESMADGSSALDASLAGATNLVESRDGAADVFMEAPLAAPPAEVSVADVQAGVDMPMVTAESESRVDDAHIVRTATLELEVRDVAASLQTARAAIAGLGGYVSGSDAFKQGESRWATVTYRVPVEHFNEAIDALRGEADRVVREATWLGRGHRPGHGPRRPHRQPARLGGGPGADHGPRRAHRGRALRADAPRGSPRPGFEQLAAQRAYLADQATLSTLTVNWYTPVAAVAAAQEGWDLGSEVDTALAQTVEALQGLVSVGVWFAVVLLPLVLLPLLALLLLVGLVRRRARRKGADAAAAA